MNEILDKQLIDCLDVLEQGEPLDMILARYPKTAVQLRPMLETAVHLAQFKIQPTLAAQTQSRRSFLARAAELRGDRKRVFLFLPLAFDWRRAFAPVAALVMALVLGVGLVNASGSALPGDALYSTKLLSEGIQLAFSGDTEARAALNQRFNDERIREIASLLASGRNAEVTFTGIVEQQRLVAWQIAGLDVHLNNETSVIGQPEVNDWVLVDGRTIQGLLLADTITLRQDNPSDETPELTPTPTEQPALPATATPTPTTDRDEESLSPTATKTSTPSPEATETPTPEEDTAVTSTPTQTGITPTSSSTPIPDGDNENGNSNSNDNEGENDNSNDNGNSNDDGNDNGDSNDNHNENDDDQETATPTVPPPATSTPTPIFTPTPMETATPTATPDDDNGNDNDNHNDNDNDNDNGNSNGNGNSGPGNGNGNSTP